MARISINANNRQADMLIHNLLQNCRGSEMDAHKASIKFRTDYGLIIDWHEYSAMLDYMHQIDEAEVTGHNRDGMTQYYIK